MVSSSASSKRARAPSNGSYNISCLVDGCEADLGSCKDYHKRHKVCEVHAKTSRVMVGGQEQRFCQQCSRFHLLVEFDEVKRSCRKRLDGHNRRRRKPQPDAISSNSGILFTSQQGAAFSSYITTTKMTTLGSNWAKATKFRGDPLSHCNNPPLYVLERQSLIPTALSHNSKVGKQLPSLQACSNQKTVEASGCSLVHKNITALDSSSSSKVPTNGLSQVLPSNCALSLLSMPLSSGRTCMPRADQIPTTRPLVRLRPEGIGRYSCLHASNGISSTGFSFSGSKDEQVGTVLVSDESDADLHAGGGGPLGSGTHQVRPWDD